MGCLVYAAQQLFVGKTLIETIILDLLLPVLVGISVYAALLHSAKLLRRS